MTTEEHIERLETRIAYQDRTIADLDDVVREFAGRVAVLERQLAELRETLAPTDAGDEPPPHY